MKHLSARLLFCLFLLTALNAPGQQKAGHRIDPFGQVTISAGGGLAYYMGDISANPGSGNLGLGPAFSLGASYRLSEHLSARGDLRLYCVSGDSRYTNNPEKNLSFRTANPDLMLALQADLLPFSRRALLNPYALIGFGVTYLTPKADWNGARYSLAPLQTEAVHYSRLPFLVSGGIGALARLTGQWSAGLELTGNFLFSDYLDDISTVYPHPDLLASDLARELSYRGASGQQPGYIRGNPKSKDSYAILQARIQYTLPDPAFARDRKRMKCPKF